MANGRVRSIVDRIRQQQFSRLKGVQRFFGSEEQLQTPVGSVRLSAIPESDQAADILEQVAGIDEQMAGLPSQTIPFGGGYGLGGFVTNNQALLDAFRNRTGAVSGFLRNLQAGVDPESMGLYRSEDIRAQRASLTEQRNRLLLGPQQSEVRTPLDRLREALMGIQASRGLGMGGSAQSFMGADAGSQIQALTSMGLGQIRQAGGGQAQPGLLPSLVERNVPTPGLPGLLELFGPAQMLSGSLDRVGQLSQEQGRFNIFNTPAFFNLL